MENDICDDYNKFCDKYDISLKERKIKHVNFENNCCNNPFLDTDLANFFAENRIYDRVLIYHPSNSKKGIAIKGTNLRVSFKYT